MKKKLMTIGITIILILAGVIFGNISVYAATEDTQVILETSTTHVQPGGTFEVTVKASCVENINGVVLVFGYEENQITGFVGASANPNFSVLPGLKDVTFIINPGKNVQSGEIGKITFYVSEDVKEGDKIKIDFNNILVDGYTDKYNVADQSITVTVGTQAQTPTEPQITKIEVISPKTTYKKGEELDVSTGELKITYSDGTTKNISLNSNGISITGFDKTRVGEQTIKVTYGGKEVTFKVVVQDIPDDNGNDNGDNNGDNDGNNGENNKPGDDGNNGGNNKPGDDGKDSTTSDKDYDKAGLNTVLISAIIVSIVIAGSAYIKNKKYKDII